jgi:rod shape-determining protein MreC
MFSFVRSKQFLKWLAIIIVIFIVHILGLSRPLERLVVSWTNPINSYFHNSLGSLFQSNSSYDSLDDLESDLQELQSKFVENTLDEAKMKLLIEENFKLRQQLDFLESNDYRALSANIISRQNIFENISNVQDIILDKGAQDGVSVGLGVVDEKGVIIGKIVEIKDNSSRACLTVAPDCRLAVGVLNDNRTVGLSEGNLGLTIKINFIPQSENISPNDIVITSGLADNIPRGLVVGRVTEVNKQSNEIWQDVSIESLASLPTLTLVSIILP